MLTTAAKAEAVEVLSELWIMLVCVPAVAAFSLEAHVQIYAVAEIAARHDFWRVAASEAPGAIRFVEMLEWRRYPTLQLLLPRGRPWTRSPGWTLPFSIQPGLNEIARGESLSDAAQRGRGTLLSLAQSVQDSPPDGRHLLAVSHRRLIQATITHIQGLPVEEAEQMSQHEGSMNCLVYSYPEQLRVVETDILPRSRRGF